MIIGCVNPWFELLAPLPARWDNQSSPTHLACSKGVIMKVLHLLLPGLLLASAASAQTSSNPPAADAPDVTVAQFRWHQEVFVPALYEDPMRINQDQRDLEREQKATARENVDRAKMGQTQIPLPTKKIAANMPVGSTPMGVPLGDEPAGNRNLPARSDPGASSVHYVYEAKIKNTGVKTIRTIVWQYILFDPETEIEVGRHHFTGRVSVRVGKTANLVGRSKTPPTRVVEVTKSGKELRGKYSERVMIDRVEYGDGSFWQRPLN
jgi:hypothetical protein